METARRYKCFILAGLQILSRTSHVGLVHRMARWTVAQCGAKKNASAFELAAVFRTISICMHNATQFYF